MEAEGLSDEEARDLLSGNLRRLREALQEEYPDKAVFLGNVRRSATCRWFSATCR